MSYNDAMTITWKILMKKTYASFVTKLNIFIYIFLICVFIYTSLHYFYEKKYEVVIIDSGVNQSELLLKGLKRDADIFHLVNNQDGIEIINEIIKEKTNISSLHIVSHGQNGIIQLGNIQLDINNVEHYNNTLSKWQKSFSKDGRIIFYGCNVAYDTQGKKFINKIKEITNLDIYASDNLTGANELNGDSDFEFKALKN